MGKHKKWIVAANVYLRIDYMEKEIYFDENGTLAENNSFLLRTPQTDDKDGYIRLCIEIAIAPGIYDDREFREVCWKNQLKSEHLEVSIIDKSKNEYVGNLLLKRWNTDTPEIGIDLLTKYRSKGIGYQTIKMLMVRTMKVIPVKYFVMRAYSTNVHSQNLIKKLGGVVFKYEESEYQILMNALNDVMGNAFVQQLKDKYDMKDSSSEEDKIICYKIGV